MRRGILVVFLIGVYWRYILDFFSFVIGVSLFCAFRRGKERYKVGFRFGSLA